MSSICIEEDFFDTWGAEAYAQGMRMVEEDLRRWTALERIYDQMGIPLPKTTKETIKRIEEKAKIMIEFARRKIKEAMETRATENFRIMFSEAPA